MAALSTDCCLGLVSPASSDCITRQEEQLAKKNLKTWIWYSWKTPLMKLKKKKLYGSLLRLLLNIHRLFTCCPIFKYCIFTNIVFRRWGCHQNAGKHYVYDWFLLWRSHCTVPQQFCGIGRPSPSHTICPSKLAAKLTLFTVHSKDSPFQVQINFLSIITPPEEADICNYKRQNASRILPFSRVLSSRNLVRKKQKTHLFCCC